MAERDEFSPKVRQAVALRAAHVCSFEGCEQLTVGPSDESTSAVSRTGVAAHIHAAAPGGKRYLASMTPEERSHIDNAIWMCSSHGTLIDQDDVTYTADRLRQMKAVHEARIAARQRSFVPGTQSDIIAIGPDVVFVGDIVATSADHWTLRLERFVIGDLGALVAFSGHFDSLTRWNRYVLVNSLGDGRVLAAAPSWQRRDGTILIDAPVEPRFPRRRAQELGKDIALGPDGDIYPDGRCVSGVDALPQRIQLAFWNQTGPEPWNADFGSRISEYYSLFHSSPWFDRLATMEAIRLASIPYSDSLFNSEHTMFVCVERVWSLELFAPVPTDDWLDARIDLEVSGLGRWSRQIRLHVPKYPFERSDASLRRIDWV